MMPRLTDGCSRSPPLVGADGAVELDPETPVDLYVARVVHPRDPEHHHPFRLYEPFEQGSLLVLGIGLDDRFQGVQDLGSSLDELLLGGVLADQLRKDGFDIRHGTLSFITRCSLIAVAYYNG